VLTIAPQCSVTENSETMLFIISVKALTLLTQPKLSSLFMNTMF